MSKALSIILGFGLIALWVVAISTTGATAWLYWLDGVMGVVTVIMGLSMADNSSKSFLVGGPIIAALCLFALWIVGLAFDATSWLTWWTFGFACAFLIPGFGSTSKPVTPHHPMTA